MTGPREEIEIKLALADAAAFARVLAHLDPHGTAPVLIQENLFFDTADLALRHAGRTLRLRNERAQPNLRGGTFTLTLKGPRAGAPTEGPLAVRSEHELAVPAVRARALRGGTLDPLRLFEEDDDPEHAALAAACRAALRGGIPKPQGGFTNERRPIALSFPLPGGDAPLVVELDRTTFGEGDVEHELEVEVAHVDDATAVEATLRTLLADLGLDGRAVAGKASRYFARRVAHAPREGD